jgi:hypothetical protein
MNTWTGSAVRFHLFATELWPAGLEDNVLSFIP